MNNNKIFLSFLGTNNYKECIYKFKDNNIDCKTKYSQIAIIRKHKEQISKYLFCLTKDAKEKNWIGKDKLKENILSEKVDEKSIYEIDIPNGFNTQELLEIFNTLVQEIHENAHLIIDVTHSFRSLPLNLSSIINYLKVTKNIFVENIYYGAFEVLGNPKEIDNIPVDNRIIEMLDITFLDSIQEWTFAIEHFLKFGNIDKLKYISDNSIKPILIDTKGKDEYSGKIRNVIKKLKELLTAIYTCRAEDILNFIENDYQNTLSDLQSIYQSKSPLLPQLQLPFKQIHSKLEEINNQQQNPYVSLIKIVNWCIKYNWIQQGFTILNEGLLTYILHETQDNYKSKSTREALSKTIHITYNKKPENDWEINDESEKEKIKNFIEKINKNQNLSQLIPIYKEVSDIRNDINHAGFRKNPMKSDGIKTKLEEYYKKIIQQI